MTSFSSVLANPQQFDGLSISMGAWVEAVGDVVVMYPSRDALQLRDSFSSFVVYGSQNPKAITFLSDMPNDGPIYVRAKGVFRRIDDSVRDGRSDPLDANRVGVMEQVELHL
jgi:hypothetical protein